MMTMMNNAKLAGIARQLAVALMRYARDRDPEHKKMIAQLQTELCAAHREELDQIPLEIFVATEESKHDDNP